MHLIVPVVRFSTVFDEILVTGEVVLHELFFFFFSDLSTEAFGVIKCTIFVFIVYSFSIVDLKVMTFLWNSLMHSFTLIKRLHIAVKSRGIVTVFIFQFRRENHVLYQGPSIQPLRFRNPLPEVPMALHLIFSLAFFHHFQPLEYNKTCILRLPKKYATIYLKGSFENCPWYLIYILFICYVICYML